MSLKSLVLTTSLLAGALVQMSHAQDLKGDAQAGEKKIAMCIGCHGIPGYQASFPEVHKVPMISGQGAKYIFNALQAYKSGERKHPTMRSIAQGLSDQDAADVAAYYEMHGKTTPAPEQLAPPPAVVAELLNKGGCAGCHGANFNKPLDPSYPKLAGQNADYLYVALKSYQDGAHTTWGRNNAIMGGMAKPLSKTEIKDIAAYLSSLPGSLVLRK